MKAGGRGAEGPYADCPCWDLRDDGDKYTNAGTRRSEGQRVRRPEGQRVKRVRGSRGSEIQPPCCSPLDNGLAPPLQLSQQPSERLDLGDKALADAVAGTGVYAGRGGPRSGFGSGVHHGYRKRLQGFTHRVWAGLGQDLRQGFVVIPFLQGCWLMLAVSSGLHPRHLPRSFLCSSMASPGPAVPPGLPAWPSPSSSSSPLPSDPEPEEPSSPLPPPSAPSSASALFLPAAFRLPL